MEKKFIKFQLNFRKSSKSTHIYSVSNITRVKYNATSIKRYLSFELIGRIIFVKLRKRRGKTPLERASGRSALRHAGSFNELIGRVRKPVFIGR